MSDQGCCLRSTARDYARQGLLSNGRIRSACTSKKTADGQLEEGKNDNFLGPCKRGYTHDTMQRQSNTTAPTDWSRSPLSGETRGDLVSNRFGPSEELSGEAVFRGWMGGQRVKGDGGGG